MRARPRIAVFQFNEFTSKPRFTLQRPRSAHKYDAVHLPGIFLEPRIVSFPIATQLGEVSVRASIQDRNTKTSLVICMLQPRPCMQTSMSYQTWQQVVTPLVEILMISIDTVPGFDVNRISVSWQTAVVKEVVGTQLRAR